MKDNSQSSMCCGPHAAGNREAGVCLFGVSRSTSDWDRSQFTDDSKIVAMSHETLNCLTIFLELPQLTPSLVSLSLRLSLVMRISLSR